MLVDQANRRTFIAGLSAAACPLVARAQQPSALIGFLFGASPAIAAHLVDAFRRGLQEAGYVQGRNVSIEFRWAENDFDRLPAMAADLVRQNVNVLVAMGGATSALAAKSATSTTPIIFSVGSDPVKLGLVASINRPGGNATGVSIVTGDLGPKRLGILRELIPNAESIAVLVNSNSPEYESQLRDVRAAADSSRQHLVLVNASSERDLEGAFTHMRESRSAALLVSADPFISAMRNNLIALANQYRLPTLYEFREAAIAGGLMSYGPDRREAYRTAGVYAGRILNGEKPANLPVVHSTKLELVINLKTAKALGLEIPPLLLARADEVIE
jgi:putative tryptophan/tyrosine transport system substrate-binding protein